MDGLECSEVMQSALERTLRIDAEFYKKEAFKILETLNSIPHKSLTTFVSVADGNHMSISENFSDKGIPYYRGQDVKSFFIENSMPICIDEETYNLPYMKRSHLKKGDILLSIVGTIGSLALVYSDKCATCSCKLAILRPEKPTKAEVVSIFLRSKYGQNQIKKFTRGAIQMGLILEDMDQLVVPIFEDEFQNKIVELVLKAYEWDAFSKTLYFQAEQLLLTVLEMNSFSSDNKTMSIKKFSDSLTKSGRLDAEYYQPKYDQLLYTLERFNTKTLGGKNGIVDIKKSIEPGSDKYDDEGIPFVRVSDITKFGIAKPQIKLPFDTIPNPSTLYPHKDTILMSKDGSVGIAYKAEEDLEAITSGALLHLTIRDTKEVLPDYLTLVLNSNIVQLQAERDANGAIIQHWKPSEIENVIIPILDMSIQKQITEMVKQSFALRRKSELLLENAKQAVEMAIEQGEAKAIAWLKEKEGEC